MTMSIIKPNGLTDAMLTSSTAAEADWPAWSAATAYAAGAKVIRVSTHRIYQRLTAGTTATAPELDAANWLDIAPTNRWAMFDSAVGTVTSVAGDLTVVLRPGAVGGMALLELTGKQAAITMKTAPGGTVIYSKTVVLDGTMITSFYDWFYEDFAQLTDLVLTDLPVHFVSNELTISITGSSTVSCGVCHMGEVLQIGRAQAGASVGIVDYSKKSVDAFGNYSITKRAFSKRSDLKLVTAAGQFNRIFRALAAIRSTPCIYIGTEAPGYEPLIVYGFYKDFSIDVAYQSIHLCNLSIEGLV
ncbi:MAG: hypothetical protein ABJA84_01980 [Polaromonas sp.]